MPSRASEPDAPIPVVLCIDVEPDGRHIDLQSPSPWNGIAATAAVLEPLRTRASQRSGREAVFSWYLRMDPQVQAAYGTLAWVVEANPAFVDAARAAGDHLGLHVHACRLDAAGAEWVIDYADAPWIDESLRQAFAAFERAVGSRCTTFRFGDHWMNQATFNTLELLGVTVDLTLEPGHDGASFYDASERFTGLLPDYSGVPTRPYRPSASDYRTPDTARTSGPWVLPVTTARVRPSLAHRVYRKYVARRSWGETTAALVSHDPGLFARLIDDALSRPEPHLVLSLRSGAATNPRYASRIAANLDALLERPEGSRLAWVEPEEAIRLLGAP